jgi:hypothetical protein
MAEKKHPRFPEPLPKQFFAMKSLIYPLILSFLATIVHAQVPVGPGSIKLGKIQVSAPTTPEFQLSGGTTKRFETKKWLEFEISYDTVPDGTIDELTFKFTAQIERKLLDGEVTYVNIAKGKDHWAVVYISPKSLDKLTGGRPFSPAALENAWVEVTNRGQVLARESLKNTPMPNAPHTPGMIVPKNQTPFASLWYDRYEEIKGAR